MECHSFCILLLFSTLLIGISGKGTSCSLSQLHSCGENEACVQVGDDGNGICKCRPGFRRVLADCVQISGAATSTKRSEGKHEPDTPQASSEHHDESGTSGWSIVLGTVIPLALIAGAVGLVYSARRYKWHERMRRLGIRRYEEVFIGRNEEEDDDDAPIA